MNVNTTYTQSTLCRPFQTLDIQFEEELNLAWYIMHPKPRPCCTLELVHEIQQWFSMLVRDPIAQSIRYIALASDVPGIFNLGGDLDYFIRLIRNRDNASLLRYAEDCIDTLLLNHHGLHRDITTMALAQGDCLGGGLEYALSSDVFIAEKSARMGFPDILFNMFPGIGAFSLLARKIGASAAEHIITGGKVYTAEEMFDMGVVDVLAEDGQGEKAIHDFIAKEQRAANGYCMFRKAKKLTCPLTRQELMDVAEIWVEAAMNVREKDIRMMQRLIKRQSVRT
ncbi:MAG: enoyl-CoA hydratase [Zetaproteobacteria bacterium]|nr:MAG: enoyl-CoA hydratase [Zetaproteobacteria bacterium]